MHSNHLISCLVLFLGISISYCVVAQGVEKKGGGNTLSFDGVDDYLDMNSAISTVEGRNTGTISFWFKSKDTTEDPVYIFTISDRDAQFDYMEVRLGESNSGLSDESLLFIVRRAGTTELSMWIREGTNHYKDKKWHHVAVRTGSGDNAIFVDGVRHNIYYGSGNASTNEFSNISAPDASRLASRDRSSWGVDYSEGVIDELRIWDRPLSLTEIRQNMTQKLTGNEAGLIGYWRLDEGGGTIANDSSPNNNDGTLQ